MTTELGKKAPDFTLATDGGGSIGLKALKGRTVILYFYPKDDTPGCTTEACGFRDNLAAFNRADAVVIGVSKDSVKSHDRFKAKHGLTFTLGADEDGKVCEAYGTWIEKSMYGRKYMGVERATFLIDGKGVLRRAWRGVKVKGHVEEVLAAAKEL